MTQPRTPPWIEALLDRTKSPRDPEVNPRYQPIGFDYEREPFDPSSYYTELGTLSQLSRSGTKVLQQRIQNQKLIELQRQQQEAIDLQGISPQPQYGPPSGLKQQKKGKFGSPLGSYRFTSGYGHRSPPTSGASSFHSGVDLAAPTGSPIYATHNGYVSFSGWNGGYGNSVHINGGGGVQTFYNHNSKNVVKSGQYVQKGQVIGYVGSTGVSTGPHLHYGVKINGQWVNPSGYY